MSILIKTKAAQSVNYAALHLKKEQVVGDIYLENIETDTLVCRITSVPEFLYEYKQTIQVDGDQTVIPAPALNIDDSFYRKELIEAREGEVRIELYHPDAPEKILGFENIPVHIQPYLHWDAVWFADTLPAFMQPNDPLVIQVLKKASEYAAADGIIMSGYQLGTGELVRKQAEYIYRALQDCKLHYISVPASFETYGQKVRICHQILHEDVKQGNCLDLTLLYATCLEAISLNCMIIVTAGHAFAGVWLETESLKEPLIRMEDVREEGWKEIQANILPVECTTFTEGCNYTFDEAVECARKKMKEMVFVADVRAAREENIVPVYTYTDKPICSVKEPDTSAVNRAFIREEFSKEKKTKIALLREQAMDITTKSRLLNCEPESLVVDLTMDSADFMGGKIQDFQIMELVEKKNSKKNNRTLRELYSKSKMNIRESGKSNLFVSVNELKWCQESTGKNYRAVIYLCPAEIYRNGRGDFQLRLDPSEVFFNPALRVFLSQRYHLDSGKMMDQPGAMYEDQMKLLSFLIENQKGWSVKENIAHLALYTIPNEAVWRGLNDESVLKHEIVSGILNGSMDWNNELGGEEDRDDISGIYTYESDSSQNAIIEAAFQRKAQVVVGPAGNGKTQTVVNIMTEAVRRGQKVLFVSEMAPAMEVAAEKLNQIFNGLFTLKIIQGKNQITDVTAQIKKTLDYMELQKGIAGIEDITEAKRKYRDCLEYLEQYYETMSVKNESCGKSLEELIDMYEKYADCPLNFRLDEKCASVSLPTLEDKAGLIASVMSVWNPAGGKYADFVRYDNVEGNEERITLNLAENALDKYNKMWNAVEHFRKELGLKEERSEKESVTQAVLVAKHLKKCPVYNQSVDSILEEAEPEEEPDTDVSSYTEEYKEELTEELRKLNRGIPVPEFLKRKQREKCFELLREVFAPDECRKMLKTYEEDPDTVLDQIDALKLEETENGSVSRDNRVQEQKELTAYLEELEIAMAEESENTREVVADAVEQIVSGTGFRIQELARRTWESYEEYAMAQGPAAEKIVKHGDEFSRKHPSLPKKVLFEEWIENRNMDSNRSRYAYDGILTELEEEGFGDLIEQINKAKEGTALDPEEVSNGIYKAWALYQIDKIQESHAKDNRFNYFIFQNRVDQLEQKEKLIRENLKLEIDQMQKQRIPNIQEGVSNNPEFGILQTLVRKKKIAIRTFFEMAPHMLMEICPCMLMDPSAVAEYIPSDFPKFNLVLIDEGSQMPTYNALIPIARANRCMIFGDEKQLQPSDEFKHRVEEDFDSTIGRESILTAAYITSMPRKMLRFHYRSENESLIAFSNQRYYNGDIITFPSCDTNVNGVSYEFVENGVYDRDGKKGNLAEAEQVVSRIRQIYEELPEKTDLTLGVITLNIHQRDLIQSLLLQEVSGDSMLGMKVDELVSVVNLESCQGKEWDYVILSPGFANDSEGRFSAGFGALNREYGENRLNVMLTRARKKMMVITSIEPYMLGNAKSKGVQDFKEFLQFAQGNIVLDSRVCDSRSRKGGLIDRIATELEKAGYTVHTNIGSSEFKVDIGIVSKEDPDHYALGILVDHYKNNGSSIHDREVIYPKGLEKKGWKIYRLREYNWMNSPRNEIRQIVKAVEEQ